MSESDIQPVFNRVTNHHDTNKGSMRPCFTGDLDFLLRVAREQEDSFETILEEVQTQTELAMLPSELLVVCSMVVLFRCDAVVESGRGWAFSTEVLSRFFRRTNVEIHSFELTRDEKAIAAENRLGAWKNLYLQYGDSRLILEDYVRQMHARRVALLIDGPKGRTGVELARRMAGDPKVKLVFIHDAFVGSRVRRMIRETFGNVIFSDHCDLVCKLRHLDQWYVEKYKGQEKHEWRPYMKGEKRMESYGPTVAVADVSDMGDVSLTWKYLTRLEAHVRRALSDFVRWSKWDSKADERGSSKRDGGLGR